MKVLIVCSETNGNIAPFIMDQVNALKVMGNELAFFTIQGKGVFGYLSKIGDLITKLKIFKPDVVHAHYGLSGLLAILQRRVPVVITFHGSDVNLPQIRKLSLLASRFSAANIFVSQALVNLMPTKNSTLLPCGIDLDIFRPLEKNTLRSKFGFVTNMRYILFSSNFDNKVKNYSLAKEAIAKVKTNNVELIELKGYTRTEVAEIMNIVDLCLLTSHNEGSPQFVKEAMACNCPIVSVDVGDVKEVLYKTEGCYVTTYSPQNLANSIDKALRFAKPTKGRDMVMRFSNESIVRELLEIYARVAL